MMSYKIDGYVSHRYQCLGFCTLKTYDVGALRGKFK